MSSDILKKNWYSLWSNTIEKNSIDQEYAYILECYNHPDKTYHNVNHLISMFRTIEPIADKIFDLKSVKLAIWYHDIIYDPQKNDNEIKSADIAAEKLYKLDISQQEIFKVKNLILLTQNHSKIDDSDTQYFLDCDLAILGKSKAEIKTYEQNIRLEYKYLTDKDYCKGRVEFLQTLSHKNIYQSEYFRKKYEILAHENIYFLIDQITTKTF